MRSGSRWCWVALALFACDAPSSPLSAPMPDAAVIDEDDDAGFVIVDAGPPIMLDPPEGPPVLEDARTLSVDGAPCDVGMTTAVDLDGRAPNGASPAEVLAYAAGTHEARLMWSESSAFELEPERGIGDVAITLEALGDRARFFQPDVPFDDSVSMPCRAWLEIDVDVLVQSRDGALNERFEATLISEDVRFAYLTATASASELQGSLEVQRDGHAPNAFELTMTFTPFGPTGRLMGTWDEPQVIAHLGHARCEPKEFSLSDVQRFDSISGQTLIESFDAIGPVMVEWIPPASFGPSLGTAAVAMSFEPDEGRGMCVIAYGRSSIEFAVTMPGTLTIESDDGMLRRAAPARLGKHVLPAASEQLYVELAQMPERAEASPTTLGFPMTDAGGLSLLETELSLRTNEVGDFTGTVSLTAFEAAGCADDPAPCWVPLVRGRFARERDL